MIVIDSSVWESLLYLTGSGDSNILVILDCDF